MLFSKYFDSAYKGNQRNILNLLERCSSAEILDIGCGDGEWTSRYAQVIGTSKVYGIEVDEDSARQAENNGVTVVQADLATGLPFKDSTFDLVHANQVIEHLCDTDIFMTEVHRVLKKGAYLVISTELGSSWHNIFALVLGWQMFSLTNIAGRRWGIGNPLSIHRGPVNFPRAMQHMRIFSYRGLIEYLELFGFKTEVIKGSGYYPLPYWMAYFDKRHCHFLVVKARK